MPGGLELSYNIVCTWLYSYHSLLTYVWDQPSHCWCCCTSSIKTNTQQEGTNLSQNILIMSEKMSVVTPLTYLHNQSYHTHLPKLTTSNTLSDFIVSCGGCIATFHLHSPACQQSYLQERKRVTEEHSDLLCGHGPTNVCTEVLQCHPLVTVKSVLPDVRFIK